MDVQCSAMHHECSLSTSEEEDDGGGGAVMIKVAFGWLIRTYCMVVHTRGNKSESKEKTSPEDLVVVVADVQRRGNRKLVGFYFCIRYPDSSINVPFGFIFLHSWEKKKKKSICGKLYY